jgi:ketosteroid isomerase-like protein/catechol 2,3-dioxygenase-like lactoylglutathione lyase family enzyme
VEINGVAHIILRVNRFDECVAFYDRLMPRLGLEAVHRLDDFVYYVGGRTALGIQRPEPTLADHQHKELAPGIDHLCFRARSREDVDALYPFVDEIGAELVRAPEDGPWAPGYYSLSFRDPEGIRLEVNYVPGKGLLEKGASFQTESSSQTAADGNVEIVRQIYDSWSRGEMRAGVDQFDPEIRFESFMPDSTRRIVCQSVGEIEKFMREFLAEWKGYRILGDEFRAVGGDKVFVIGRQAGTGRRSGVAVEGPVHSVWTFRNAKVVRLVFEPELVQALEAAGLSDVELVRELFERRMRGDYAIELLDPEIVYTQNGELPDFAGAWTGLDAIRAATRAWLSAWENIRYTLENVASRDGRVVVHETLNARGVRSQVATTHTCAHVLEVRAAKIVRWDVYWNPSDALISLEAR